MLGRLGTTDSSRVKVKLQSLLLGSGTYRGGSSLVWAEGLSGVTLSSQQMTSGLAVELLGSLESEDMKPPEVGICALPSKTP